MSLRYGVNALKGTGVHRMTRVLQSPRANTSDQYAAMALSDPPTGVDVVRGR